MRRRRAAGEPRACRRGGRYFVLVLELLLPLGEVVAEPLTPPDALPDGVVVSVVVEELELEVVSDERGVPGDADGLVRSGRVVPTRSVSVRLHAAVIPPASASAQSPDSNFFIADAPPLWGVSTLRGTVQRPCPWYDSSPRRYVAQRRLAA